MKSLALRLKGQKRSETAPPKKAKSKRRRLYDLHTWVGFHLAVIMVVVLFTGTFATISNELDWLTQHDMRVSPGEEKVSYETMLDSVREYNPDATILGVSEMMGDRFAYRVTVFDENATQQFIHVNQWTGEVTGQTPYFTMQRFFRDMHRYLYLPKIVGLTLVCSMAIILTISLYTGLKTSRNWRTLMTRIRFNKGARIAVGDAHKAAGIWSIWFFVLIIVTGLWYYAEFLGKNFEPAVPEAVKTMEAISDDVIGMQSADEIIRVAQKAYPDLKIESVSFPSRPGTAIRVTGSGSNPIVRRRANAVFIDPGTLDVLHVRKAKDLPALQWTNQIVDPLHFGNFGGMTVKLIYFVFGLFMTALSVSGVWLTWKRLKSRGATKIQIATLPVLVVSALIASATATASAQPILAGVSPMPYVIFVLGLFLAAGALLCTWWLVRRVKKGRSFTFKNIIIATLALVMTAGATYGSVIQNPYKDKNELALGMVSNGPIHAELHLARSVDGAYSGETRFLITTRNRSTEAASPVRLNAKNMVVTLKEGGGPVDPNAKEIKKRFRIPAVTQPAFFTLPKSELNSATEIIAKFEMPSGQTYEISWQLP